MPLAHAVVAWSRPRFAAHGPVGRVALLGGLICLVLPLYLVLGLWFDLVYATLGRLAGRRLSSRVRAVVSAASVIVLIAAIGSTSPAEPAPAPGPSANAVAARASESRSTGPTASHSSGTVAPTATGAQQASAEFTATPALSASASPIDVDDGDTGAVGGAPPTAATTTDPNASAVGWLPGEPNPRLTPGALNPAVTQATIGSTICVSGWTATIRPSSSYTTSLKIEQIGEYGYPDTSTASYEEDHLIPLELGGAPSDPRNLWPEPYASSLADGRDTGAHVKDGFETSLKRQVCGGSMTLAQAQAEIGDYWVHAFYGIPVSSASSPVPTQGSTTATPRPTAIGTPRPIATKTPPPATLTVRITSVTNPVVRGTSASVSAATTAGAVCTIKVTLPSGRVSTVAALLQSRTASASGAVNWTWTVTSNTGTGTAHVSVTCSLGGKAGSAATTFSIVS